jgi:hypothetical protein
MAIIYNLIDYFVLQESPTKASEPTEVVEAEKEEEEEEEEQEVEIDDEENPKEADDVTTGKDETKTNLIR